MINRSRLWWSLGLLAFALAYWWNQALLGFNATDDGFVIGQSWRILIGETPHVDFTSPRPLGSAYLHVIDVLSPWATLAISRLIVTLQLLWISFALVDLLARRMRIPHATLIVLSAVAFVINAGTWPIMAWHTIDGLFIGATAVWLASHSKARWLHPTMWLLAGLAPLMKQGFVLVPFAVAAVLLARKNGPALRWFPAAFIPGIAYWLITRNTPGGLGAQLYGGTSNEGLSPARGVIDALLTTGGLLMIMAVALVMALLAAGLGRRRPTWIWAVATFLIIGTALVNGQSQGFGIAAAWSYGAFAAFVIASAVTARSLQSATASLALIALAYASAASWGAPAPTLIAGSLTVGTLIVLMNHVERTATPWWRGSTLIALVALGVTLLAVIPFRNDAIYREGPRSAMVGSVDVPGFWGIRMSEQSAAMTNLINDCTTQYPAQSTAILPDNAGVYPLLRLRNPFHLDWWTPEEIPVDSAERTQATIQMLNASGDWLVLFQTIPVSTMAAEPVERITADASPADVMAGVQGIRSSLVGVDVRCGSLVGIYRPS